MGIVKPLLQAFVIPVLRTKREGRGTHYIASASECERPATRPSGQIPRPRLTSGLAQHCIATGDAAPSIAVFDGWAARTSTSCAIVATIAGSPHES